MLFFGEIPLHRVVKWAINLSYKLSKNDGHDMEWVISFKLRQLYSTEVSSISFGEEV